MEMIINGEKVKVLCIDFEHGLVDWRRTEGKYMGACVSEIGTVTLSTAEANLKTAIEAEMKRRDNPLAKAVKPATEY